MGVDHASIRLPQAGIDPLSRHDTTRLDPGQPVTVRFGEHGATGTELETFTLANTPRADCDVTPLYADVYSDSPATHSPLRDPFANNGRHSYRRWNVGFDSIGGVAKLTRHPLLAPLLTRRKDILLCSATCTTGCTCHSCTA
jgi:hypothetical protein